jgi:hypothetical protein
MNKLAATVTFALVAAAVPLGAQQAIEGPRTSLSGAGRSSASKPQLAIGSAIPSGSMWRVDGKITLVSLFR